MVAAQISPPRARWTALLLAAVACLGLAHVAALPPFEGMDETGHYSSIAQIADTGTIPVLGWAWIAQEVKDYERSAPMPHSLGPNTYRSFFAGSPRAVGQAPSPAFMPSNAPNWEAQHPPLYYVLLAPIAKAIAGQSLESRLLALRLASLVFALVSLAIVASANQQFTPWGGIATVAWPILMPEWFPEMARLGNDSLAFLLLSIAWAGLAAILCGGRRLRWWILTGIALGLGCATKAYIVPIALGCAVVLAGYAWRHDARRDFALCASAAVILGAPWYVWLALEHVSIANDAALLAAGGGLRAGLREHWSALGFMSSVGSMVKSFVWAGTWSFARPPVAAYLPVLLGGLAVVIDWLRTLGRAPVVALAPLAMVVPMLAGLAGHALLWMALDATDVTGGWYLHVLTGPLALIVALALPGLLERRVARIALAALALYCVIFTAVLSWLQVGLFTGCAYREGASPLYRVDPACLFDPALMFDRLALLAHPALALIGAAGAVAFLAVGGARLIARR